MENHSLPDDTLDSAGAPSECAGMSRVLVRLDRSELSETGLKGEVMIHQVVGIAET